MSTHEESTPDGSTPDDRPLAEPASRYTEDDQQQPEDATYEGGEGDSEPPADRHEPGSGTPTA